MGGGCVDARYDVFEGVTNLAARARSSRGAGQMYRRIMLLAPTEQRSYSHPVVPHLHQSPRLKEPSICTPITPCTNPSSALRTHPHSFPFPSRAHPQRSASTPPSPLTPLQAFPLASYIKNTLLPHPLSTKATPQTPPHPIPASLLGGGIARFSQTEPPPAARGMSTSLVS